ncbi:immunoglobulin domain-containing protein, partial [Sinomicrobium sp. M5D2P9]
VDVLWGTGGDIASTANFVRDVANAFDGDDTTFAHLRANLAVLSEGVHITALYPTLSVEGDGVRVLLQREEGGLIDASVLSDNIRIRTYNNNDANSELTLDPELIQLSLFPGTTDVYELIYPVNVPFNRIEVSFDSGLASAFEGLHVYELDRAQDVPGGEFPDPISPFHAVSQENGVDGVCLLCDVVNPEFSVDFDPDNYTELNTPLGVASGIWQDLIFPFGGLNGDIIEVELGVGGGLVDFSVLGGLTLESFNGATPNGDGISLSEPVNIKLVPGTTDRYIATFVAGADFDRVRVKFAAVLEALTNVRVYGARLRYGMPEVSGNLVEPGTAANLQLTPVSPGDGIEWFAEAEGGTPIATGLNYTTPALNVNTTYYIEITRDGLTEPVRYPVTVGINFPPTEGARERVYACSQDNLAIGGVQNPEFAVDGDPSTHSTFTILKVGAFYQRLSFADCAVKPAAGDALHIKLGTEAGLLEV